MRILLADDDPGRGKRLSEACAAGGHIIDRAVHGAAALEMALERVPALIVCPIDLPIIDGARLAEILRGNPRTRDARFLFLVDDVLETPVGMDVRDGVLEPPWGDAELGDQLERMRDPAPDPLPSRAQSEVAGSLEQLSLPDLLQLFLGSRRTGLLAVSGASDAGAGSLALDAGQVVSASVRTAEGLSLTGEKALFRLLSWRTGHFEFSPTPVEVEQRIERSTRALLLEGARQLDEWDRLRPKLPPQAARLRLRISRSRLPDIVHPLWRQVLDTAASDAPLSSIVDRCPAPDYQVLRAIQDLMARGALAVVSPAPEVRDTTPAPAELLTPKQVRRIGDWMDSQRTRPGRELKVLVLPSSETALACLMDALEAEGGLARRRPARDPSGSTLAQVGTLAELPLGEELCLRLVGVSADPLFAPLLDVASHGALGGLAVLDGSPDESARTLGAAISSLIRGSGRPIVPLATTLQARRAAESGRLRSGIPELDATPLLALPADPAGRRGALQNAFARLVP
ncbi:MAG: DUF4388 domain-containing protein [Myxococcota bacterium]